MKQWKLAIVLLVITPVRAQTPVQNPWISPRVVKERIQWLHAGPWGANDDRGEGVLLTNPTLYKDRLGLLQEFTFHDESALELRFSFREHDVDVFYRRHDVGSGSVPPEGSHAAVYKVEKNMWQFEFRTTIDLNRPPQLRRIELVFEGGGHFTETIEWLDGGVAHSQTFHFRNYGPLGDLESGAALATNHHE